MIRFAHPEYLNALYLLPIVVIIFYLLYKNKNKLLEKFADKELHTVIVSSYSNVKNYVKFGLILLAFACLIIAAANPQVGTKLQEVKQTGIDVFILLDVSLSLIHI